MANKARLQTAGDGTAIPSGYVGEVQRTFKSTASSLNVPAITFTNIKDNAGNDATITLGAGIWLITSQFSLGGNVSTADNNKQVAISEYSGNITTDHVTGTNLVYASNPTAALDGVSSISFVVTNSTSKTYYAKVFLAVAASAAVIRFNVQAVRIA